MLSPPFRCYQNWKCCSVPVLQFATTKVMLLVFLFLSCICAMLFLNFSLWKASLLNHSCYVFSLCGWDRGDGEGETASEGGEEDPAPGFRVRLWSAHHLVFIPVMWWGMHGVRLDWIGNLARPHALHRWRLRISTMTRSRSSRSVNGTSLGLWLHHLCFKQLYCTQFVVMGDSN
jgi:hypothetical protein